MLKFIFSAAIGAALAYFLDPDRGKGRRAMAKDRLTKTLRQGSESVKDTARYTASKAEGISQKVTSRNTIDDLEPNDPTLVQKVESEIFRDPEVPKGQININAENGVVVLRGQLDNPDQIRRVEESVRAIPGVEGVENLLHLPDAPAPHAV
jgi:osmotically-inducible protein OsmY